MIFAFATCELDLDRRELRRDGAPVHVEPQVFDLLAYMVRHRDRLIGKDELFGAIWHGRIVSEAALTTRISAARRAIGDTGEDQALLRTVARRGVRFTASVEERTGDRDPDASRLSALPTPTTSLLGRDFDLAELAKLLRGGARLVTLTNIGGVGKTRLALSLAADLEPGYPDGVRLVELAAVSLPGAVPASVAGVLGIAQRPNITMTESIVQALRPCRSLLVIDNCEHVIDAAAALIRTILTGCPRISILATSREVLAIDGEHVWPVSPLSCDGPESLAVQLFLERAEGIAPDAGFDSERDVVADICRELDGIPLAIELAAARVRAMSLTQIRHRLSGRFHLLTTAPRGAEARHQTLYRAVSWSFDLLTEAERVLLARVAVFAGGFSLEAAENICAGGPVAAEGVLDLLDSLVRKSLLTTRRPDHGIRYGVLETVRQFSAQYLETLGEAETIRDRHASLFATHADANFTRWRGPAEQEAYLWLDQELDNLRAAYHWAHGAGRVDIAARIASDIGDMARFRLRDEAATWAPAIVDAARKIRHPRLIILLTWASSWAWGLGRLREAIQYGEEAISVAGDPAFEPFSWAFTDLAMIAVFEGDAARAAALAREGATREADARDRFCLAMLPYFLTTSGHEDEAMASVDHAVSRVDAAGVPFSASIVRWSEGKAFARRDITRALAAFEQAAEIARRSGNLFWEILSSLEMAALRARGGAPVNALRSFRRLLDDWRHSRDLMVLSHGLGALVVLFERLTMPEPAATLNGALTWANQASPFVPELPDVACRLVQQLGQRAFEYATERGAAMTPREANDYAIAQVDTALVTIALG